MSMRVSASRPVLRHLDRFRAPARDQTAVCITILTIKPNRDYSVVRRRIENHTKRAEGEPCHPLVVEDWGDLSHFLEPTGRSLQVTDGTMHMRQSHPTSSQ